MKLTNRILACCAMIVAFAGTAVAGINDGLVGYYSFDSCDVADGSGNGNNGYVVPNASAPVCVPGLKGTAFSYAGMATCGYNCGYLNIPNSPSLSFLDNFTFSLWFNIRNHSSMDGWGQFSEYGMHSLFAKSGDREGLIVRTIRDTNDGLLRLFAYNGGYLLGNGQGIFTTTGFNLDEWHLATITSGNGEVRLYFDGKLESSMPTSTFNINPQMAYSPLQLGMDEGGYWYPIDGMLDDVRVYNRALAENEVRDLYLAGVGITVTIDIKPGGTPNSINPRNNGVIPVAILTTTTFDAATVDPATVRFGAAGTEAAPAHSALEDVNGDGKADLVLQFPTQNTGIVCGTTAGLLTGKTRDGVPIQGTDSIVTAGCK